MAECDAIGSCSLLKDMLQYAPNLAQETQRAYCQADYTSCARYMLIRQAGPEHVPPDILPGDVNRARELISRARRNAARTDSK